MSMDAEKDSRIEKRGRKDIKAKQVLMPDIYAAKPVSKKIDITIVNKPSINKPSTDTDESSGFNPYDTASLFKK